MDLKHKLLLLIPVMSLLAVGTYIIAETYLITKDGPLYITQAKQFGSEPLEVIKNSYFGYPALIFATQKICSVFGAQDAATSWAVSAQNITLLCMLASFIPLYFIGKHLIGEMNTLYFLIILAFLPYPVRFACDVLRDWPYVLFLSLSFAALLAGAKGKHWWMFGLSGLLAGLGYFIKIDCGQTIIYALIWLGLCFIKPRYQMTRVKAVLCAVLLLVCFSAVVLPYMQTKGQFVPEKIQEQINENETESQSTTTATLNGDDKEEGLVSSLINVFERTSENMFHYFLVFALTGFYIQFILKFKETSDIEKTFIISFILLNVIMLGWLSYSFGYLSRRHCLPLSLLFLLYAPIGLRAIGEKLDSVCSPLDKNPPKILLPFKRCLSILGSKTVFWVHLLILVGVIICLPTLLGPKRRDLAGFLDAAYWLNHYTKPEDLIVVPDERISFYAERNGRLTREEIGLGGADYAVALVEGKDIPPDWGQQKISFLIDPDKKEDRLVIYELN
ncbi:MAG: glycosyltransferase family 39 protein [Sedimentisphaerales bacterium]|nr:glycosyltransferase family 39 protein [Sedimentisphaerales bacterium]